MQIILASLFGLGIIFGSLGLYLFHKIYLDLVFLKFNSNLSKFFYFFLAYLGLFIFVSIWGVFFYLLYLFLDFVYVLSWIQLLVSFLFFTTLAFSLVLFFIEAVHYQFTFISYWQDSSDLFFVISSIFLYSFLSFFFVYVFYFMYISLLNFAYVSAFFSLIFFIWIVSFLFQLFYKKSLFTN